MPDEALDAALSIGEYSSRSDAACKEALACKEVLVRILQGCVPEYRNCTEEEIAACIEGQPLVGELPVDRDLTNPHRTERSRATTRRTKRYRRVRFCMTSSLMRCSPTRRIAPA